MADTVGPRLIVALDTADARRAEALARAFDPALCRLKVGKELFTAAGPALVERLSALGFDVFLDLKYHDIPNTVAAAVRAAAGLGVWMVNVHALGGERMLAAARDALPAGPHRPLLTAVTVLTSHGPEDLAPLGIPEAPDRLVARLAALALGAGLDGLVCSAREAAMLRAAHGPAPVLVTPGIRPAGSGDDDQRRVVTPADALGAGADHLVVGRPLTRADDPGRALADLARDVRGATD